MIGNSMKVLQADYNPTTTLESFRESNFEPFQYIWEFKDLKGQTRLVDVTMTALFDKGQLFGFMGVSRDVTKSAQLTKDLATARHEQSLAIKTANLGFWVYNLTSKKLRWNAQLLHMYGIPVEEWDEEFDSWRKRVHPEDLKEADSGLDPVIEKNEAVYGIQFRIIRKNDGAERVISGSAIPLLGDDGELKEIMGVNLDITDFHRKNLDLQESLEELQMARSEMDYFAYSIAHDLRAPVASSLGLLNLLDKDTLSPRNLKLIKILEKAINRFENTLRDMTDFFQGRDAHEDLSSINILNKVSSVLGSLKFHENFNAIKFEVSINPELNITTERRKLSVIISNLISNAIKYSDPKKEELRVTISAQLNNSELVFSVEDNGLGIRKDLQDKVFKMFYLAHKKQYGTGLGLYIARQSAEQLGGELGLESEPGIGSRFILRIPQKNESSLNGRSSLKTTSQSLA